MTSGATMLTYITLLPRDRVDEITDEEDFDDEQTGEVIAHEVSGPVEVFYNHSENIRDSGVQPSASSTAYTDVGPPLNRQTGKCRRRNFQNSVAEQPVTVESAASTTQPSACTQPKVGRPLKRPAGKFRLPSPSNMQMPASRPTSTNNTSCSETNMISSPVWKKCMPKYTSSSLPGSAPDNMKSELRTKLSELTPTQLFEQFFTPDMFDLMARETQPYAKHVKNDVDFVTSAVEMRAVVGILLLSGYNIRSSEKDYWSEADDLKAKCLQNLMPKNRYLKLKASLHFSDNSLASQIYSDGRSRSGHSSIC